jgi:hypothetical protein
MSNPTCPSQIKKRSMSPLLPPSPPRKKRSVASSSVAGIYEPMEVKEEHEFSLVEDARAAETEINNRLRKISRIKGNFVDLSFDDE